MNLPTPFDDDGRAAPLVRLALSERTIESLVHTVTRMETEFAAIKEREQRREGDVREFRMRWIMTGAIGGAILGLLPHLVSISEWLSSLRRAAKP